MSLAAHVKTLGRGPGRSRSLTRKEASDAMRLMLSGTAAPEAIGALLMLLRMKGETAEEIAGLAQAAQMAQTWGPSLPLVDLDWPSYAAGRTRGQPWFLYAARLVADAGHTVLIHGYNGPDPKVRAGLARLGIGTARNTDDLATLLHRDRIAYLPLEQAHPALFALLNLRSTLGLRSCINTVCRMLNPARASASVQGVFHPAYRALQTAAAQHLGWSNLTVIKGGGGEFERHPAKDITGCGLRKGTMWEEVFPLICDETRRLADDIAAPDPRFVPAPPSDFESAIITGTASLALHTLGVAKSDHLAGELLQKRRRLFTDPAAA